MRMFSRTKAIHLKRIPIANEGKSSCWQLTSKSPCSFNFLLIPNPAGPARCNLGGLTASPKGCQDKAALSLISHLHFLIWHFLLKRYRYQTSYYMCFQRKKGRHEQIYWYSCCPQDLSHLPEGWRVGSLYLLNLCNTCELELPSVGMKL